VVCDFLLLGLVVSETLRSEPTNGNVRRTLQDRREMGRVRWGEGRTETKITGDAEHGLWAWLRGERKQM